MRMVSFYFKDTGLLSASQLLASDDEMVSINTPPGCAPIDGHYDSLSQRVDIANPTFVETTGPDGNTIQTPVYSVIDYQPPQPSADYEWNASIKRWQLTAAMRSKIDNRNSAMAAIARLEAAQHRAVREFAIGMAGAADRLAAIDAEIVSLRAQL